MLKIIVPTDFSPNATRAIDYAVQLAKTGKASLMIIHASDKLMGPGLEAGLPFTEYNQRITDDAFANLELVKKGIEQAEQIKVETELYSGAVVDAVVTAAKETGAGLIIMGTMGINSIKDTLFGTNTSAVIAGSDVPVLAIPLEYSWTTPRNFLLALNNFHEAGAMVQPAFDLARIFSSAVKLVVFTDEEEASAADFMADAQAIREAEEKLKGLFPDIVINTEHLSGRYFEDTIGKYTEEHATDVLAMTTHKRSLLGNIFNRSITRKMSYHTKVPLLAIPVK
jgi:nucleotide-binding universal stress UspA family protein